MNIPAVFVGALLVAGVLPLAGHIVSLRAAESTASAAAGESSIVSVDWPTHFRDQPLTQLPLSAVEARFARRFPGAIARFAAGDQVVIVRQVNRPTRQLHPAEDCFKAVGYALRPSRLSEDDQGRRWRCFVAERGGERLRVCERISADDEEWTDVSSWFWAAQYGGGPWRALTVVSREPS